MSCQANLLSDVFMDRFLKSIEEENAQAARRDQELVGLVSNLQASFEALQDEETELAVQRSYILQSISPMQADMNRSLNISNYQLPEKNLCSTALQGSCARAYGHEAACSALTLEEEVQQPLSLKAALGIFSTPRHNRVHVNTNTLWAVAA